MFMKRILTGGLLGLAAAMALISCEKLFEGSFDEPDYTYSATKATYYYGKADSESYDYCQLSLENGDLKESDGAYSGQGAALLLDMNVTKDFGRVPAGTYLCEWSDDDFVFMPGSYTASKGYTPSYVYERVPGDRSHYYTVEDGRAVIGLYDGGTSGKRIYSVDAVVKTSNGYYRFTYAGEFTDGNGGSSDGGDGGDGGDSGDGGDGEEETTYPDIDISDLAKGNIIYYGGDVWYYDGVQIANDYSDWLLYIVAQDDDINDNGANMLQLDLLAGKDDVRYVASGVYSSTEGDVTATTCVPFRFVSAFEDEDGYCNGCWYFDEDNGRYYGLESGTVEIVGRTDDKYTIVLNARDETYSADITGRFEASLTYIDDTASESSSAPALSVQSTMKRLSGAMPFRRQVVSKRSRPAASSSPQRSFAPRF